MEEAGSVRAEGMYRMIFVEQIRGFKDRAVPTSEEN